jgi:hypothetical protein
VKETRDKLHTHIVVNVLTHVLISSNLNFGNTTLEQREVKAKAKTQMLGRRCIAIRMQQPIIIGEHELLVRMQQQ